MIFLVILHIFVSFVLILVILLQTGKGGGLSESFGGVSQQIFGTKSSTFLNRATAVCAILFLVTCLSLGIFSSYGRRSILETAPPEVQEPEATLQKSDETPPKEKTAETPTSP